MNNDINIISILNTYFGSFWFVILVGLLHSAFRERELLCSFFRHSKVGKNPSVTSHTLRKKSLRSAAYFIGGCLMVLSAWSIVITLVRFFFAGTGAEFAQHATKNMFTPFRDSVGSFDLLGVVGFITAGTCFTLSAGERWLVNIGKFFTTATIIGLGWLYVFAALG